MDEAELDAELEALGEEVEFGGMEGLGEEPAFLQEASGVPSFIDAPVEEGKTKEAAT